jgi:hypothetical protein
MFIDTVCSLIMGKQTTALLNDCGVTWYDVGKVDVTSNQETVFMRWFLNRDFLSLNGHWFDRVIMCDLTDVVFQGDPFDKDFRTDVLSFPLETVTGCGLMTSMLGTVVGLNDAGRWILNQRHINGGIVWGHRDKVEKFLDYFHAFCTSHNRSAVLAASKVYLMNQLFINALVRSGMMTNIRTRLTDCAAEFCCLWSFGGNIYPNMTKTIGDFRPFGRYSTLVHLYDRFIPFVSSVVGACPPTFLVQKYVRTDMTASY